MKYRVELFIKKYRRSGIIGIAHSVFLLVIRKCSPFEIRADFKRRRIGSNLHKRFGGQVSYGAFKGLKVPKDLIWAKNDLASILIGFYEQQVIQWIVNQEIDFLNLIDVGSADGFYLAGILKSELANCAVGFESNKSGRESSLSMLKLNGLQERAVILGKADLNFMNAAQQFVHEKPDRWSLLLCDIEGGELEIFDCENAKLLEKYFLVIELHEWMYAVGDLDNLKSIFSATHELQFLRTSSRQPSLVSEIQDLSDDQRWNLCSEGRRHEMRWLVGVPHLFKSSTLAYPGRDRTSI